MDHGTERGKEEGNERNEEPARCPLPAAREAQFPKQHHGAWQTPGHGWIGGGYNSGSIGDVCWDGALAITEQKHPRPILVSLVSQARGRCDVGASSPFCDSYFSIRGSPIKTLIVDSCRYREQSRVRNRPPWRCLEINQPTNACLARPSRLFRSGRIPTGVEGGATPCSHLRCYAGGVAGSPGAGLPSSLPSPRERCRRAVRFLVLACFWVLPAGNDVGNNMRLVFCTNCVRPCRVARMRNRLGLQKYSTALARERV